MTSTPDDGRKFVVSEIETLKEWTFGGRKRWSFLNNGSTILIIACGAIAAVLSQPHSEMLRHGVYLHHVRNHDIVTVLTLTVTILTAVQSKIGFERKWIANRLTQTALAQLEVDEKLGVDAAKLGEAYKAIIGRHDQMIVGSDAATPKP